jgi:hypothetical protein
MVEIKLDWSQGGNEYRSEINAEVQVGGGRVDNHDCGDGKQRVWFGMTR